ncbi:25170_t:CDS:2 [Cetraspora pellucida]|uniref:25170_t:CDS:1 n=1 Tax=Cetraspora pellucida TaxID=1433469 RepID=A0A9N9H2D2_9GLOM|nr:25170_t:CDS:2 [Cetraspora pellucida]
MVHTSYNTQAAKATDKTERSKVIKVDKNEKVDKSEKVDKNVKLETKPDIKSRKMASPRSRGRGKRSTNTPTRSSPRIVRRSASYPNAVNRHFVDSVPILEITLRFDEDEYDVWRRQDTDEVNLYYLLRIKYPRDEDEGAWLQELEKLKNEIKEIRVIDEGWFEGVWVPLEHGTFRLSDYIGNIAQKYNIYEHVAALLESENSWFDTPKKQNTKVKSEREALSHTETSESPNITALATTSTRSIVNNSVRSTPNGTIKSDEVKVPRRTSARLQARSVKQEPSKRLREVDMSDRGDVKEKVQSLKRKLDEKEEYMKYGLSNKKRAVMAGIGAAVGAGVAMVIMNSMGIGPTDIASGISDLPSKLGSMF